MTNRTNYNKCQEIGAFIKLTNSYCLVSDEASDNFMNTIQSNIGTDMPIIPISIANSSIIGRLCVGNKYGLLVPASITDDEWNMLSESLPAGVDLRKIDDKFSALGNVIVCNDQMALVHPDIENDTEKII